MSPEPITGIVEVPADDIDRLVRYVHRFDAGGATSELWRCMCGSRGRESTWPHREHVEFMVREAMVGRVLP